MTERDKLEAEARRLDCLPAIQPLLDIIDWCGRERDKLDDLEELLALRPKRPGARPSTPPKTP